MTNKSFTYIKISRQEGFAETSGIPWVDFYNGIPHKPENLLILAGWCCQSYNRVLRHGTLGLEYICNGKTEPFSPPELYGAGDLSWVDFADEADLDAVTEQELAELLYFQHKVMPLHGFSIPSLRNRYAYYSHDDDWFSRVYMERLEDILSVAEYQIRKGLKGRKRTIAPLPENFRAQLLAMFEEGAVIDFKDAGVSSVTIYPVGDRREFGGMDDIHWKLDEQREHCLESFHFWYDTSHKSWRTYK